MIYTGLAVALALVVQVLREDAAQPLPLRASEPVRGRRLTVRMKLLVGYTLPLRIVRLFVFTKLVISAAPVSAASFLGVHCTGFTILYGFRLKVR